MQQLNVMPIRTRITSILRKAIYLGEYKAGQELSLTDVANELGVSRTPVREAFQALASEGLITLRMNKGAIVNTIDRKFIKDNFEMRILLESEASAKAAQNGMETEDLLVRLKNLKQNLERTGSEEYEQLNSDIHMRIWDAADNDRLKAWLLYLWNGPSTGHSVNEEKDHYRLSTDEHIAIVESIKDQDTERARALMKQHIERSETNILARFPETQEETAK